MPVLGETEILVKNHIFSLQRKMLNTNMFWLTENTKKCVALCLLKWTTFYLT